MKIKISFQDFNTQTYIIIFIVLIVTLYIFMKWIYSKAQEPDDDDDDDDSDTNSNDVNQNKKMQLSLTEKFFASDKPKMLIFYGTQTGTSEEFGNLLEEAANKTFGFAALLLNLYDYEEYLPCMLRGEIPIVVFLLSTYGEGEPCDSGRDFLNYISKGVKDSFERLNYCIFGCGNSQYCKRYQMFANNVEKYLKKRGAKELLPIGYGDSDKYIDDDFENWSFDMLEKFSLKFSTKKVISNDPPQEKFKVIWIDHDDPDDIPPPFNRPRVRPNQKTPFYSAITYKKELLHNDKERSTLEVHFDITGSRILYEAGDHLGVMAENSHELIEAYAKRLGVTENLQRCLSVILVKIPVKGNRYMKKTTLYNMFKWYVDLTSAPKKKAIRFMAEYAKNESEKKELMFLCSRDGKNKYNSKIIDGQYQLLDLLNEYKSVELPLNVFMEISPMMQPRYYSISSSSLVSPNTIALTVSLVRFTTQKGINRKGVCTAMIERAKVGTKYYVWVRESRFHLPENNTMIPIIMVSNGCGFAPLKGFLDERKYLKETKGKSLGKALLFFGSRNKKNDWLYGDYQTDCQGKGIISNLYTAFSRDQKKKIYVQHLFEDQKLEIVRLIENGAYVYVCGTNVMGNEIQTLLGKLLIEYMKDIRTEEDVDKLMEDRFIADTWSL